MDTGKDPERIAFQTTVMNLIRPQLAEEMNRLATEQGGLERFTDIDVEAIVLRLLGRFYDLGMTEATMYMPLVMKYIKSQGGKS